MFGLGTKKSISRIGGWPAKRSLLALAAIALCPSPAAFSQISACDVNGDSSVNISDVQRVVNMSTGVESCTVNITGAGVCNVTTVQRVVNAALGQPCVVDSTSSPGLVAAYSFDEGTGTTVADSSGNGNHGTVNATSWTPGRFGQALAFNGTSSWVTVNDSNSLDLTSGMTLEAWVFPTRFGAWNTVVMKERSGGLAYALGVDGSGLPDAYIWVNNQFNSVLGSMPLALNTWAHLAISFDASVLRLYVNGSQVASRNVSGSLPVTGNPLRIGGNSVWSEWFNGSIDEVRIYNRPLSQSEIQADMNRSIGNLPADTTAPTVSMTAPAAGSTLSGTVTVSASASDNVAVAGVQFLLNGANLGSEVTGPGPYAVSWNTAGVANGTYTLAARARDASGNAATSSSRSVTVSNVAPAPKTVTLSWTASTTAGVNYNIYRGTTSGGPYATKVNATPVTGTSFTDTTVVSGQTYYYVARAVDGTGTESVNSNQAIAAVP